MSVVLEKFGNGEKLVLGMVQLPPLPESANHRGEDLDAILSVGLSEARILAENGVDALMVQNLGDLPVHHSARAVQVAWMTRVMAEIRREFDVPVGLNLLENDAEAMLAIASGSDADFVRIKVYVGAMMTPFGTETAQAHTAIKLRNRYVASDVAIFADVHDRTGTPIATSGFEEDVEFAVRLGLADGLVLTGKSYEQTLDFIDRARAAYPDVPILVGGGVKADNFHEVMAKANGAIVSTAMKTSGSAVGQFDPEKVRSFMAVVRQ